MIKLTLKFNSFTKYTWIEFY